MGTVWKVLTRKKVFDDASAEETRLSRQFGVIDLTALGVGSTLGVGVYVLVGQVARETAGPAVVLSFLLAAIASAFAGLCYAEFGARTPRAGSAYIYSYVCVGEFIAFVIGWNLILEYVIGSASVARGLSAYLDTLVNNSMQNTFIEIAPMHVSFMSRYFDFFAFGISILLSVGLAFGMKESNLINKIFTGLNIGVVLFVIIAGSVKADFKNWDLHPKNTTEHVGKGGFFPFGVEGMIKGAATCFYGFVGFDCIATTGEEVRNPKKAIPIAITLSLFIIFLAYFGTSMVVTLMVPYYEQDEKAAIPFAFEAVGLDFAKWIVVGGGIFALCASLFGAMFPLPRIIYAMASDNIIFSFLGKVNSYFKTPVTGTLLAGLLTGLMAGLFELDHLVSMMSIGTLLAYTIVAASVLLLRYSRDEDVQYAPVRRTSSDSEQSDEYSDNRMEELQGSSEEILEDCTKMNVFKQIFNCRRHKFPSNLSEGIVSVEVFIYCILCIFIGLCGFYLKDELLDGTTWAIVLTSVSVGAAALVIISMATQPSSNRQLNFKVPLVPFIPALSILINIYLMLMLDSNTWIRFGVWMAVGLPMYYYCVRTNHSEVRNESVVSVEDWDKGSVKKLNGFINNGFLVEPTNEKKLYRPASSSDDQLEFDCSQGEDLKIVDEDAFVDARVLSENSSLFNVKPSFDLDLVEDQTQGVSIKVQPPTPRGSLGTSSGTTVITKYGPAVVPLDNSKLFPYNPEEYREIKTLPINSKLEKVQSESLGSSDTEETLFEAPPPPPLPSSDILNKEPYSQVIPPPPPPPPLAQETKHPPPLFTVSEVQEVTLKPSKKRSKAPDVPLKPSSEELQKVVLRPTKNLAEETKKNTVEELPEGHLKFHSTLHKKFVQKLDSFYKMIVGDSEAKSQEPPQKRKVSVNKDYVFTEPLDRDLAKKNLLAFYQKRYNLEDASKEVKRSSSKKGVVVVVKPKTNEDGEVVTMQDVFKEIRQRRMD